MTYSGLRIIIAIVYIILNVLVLKLLRIKKSKAKIAIIISVICFVVFLIYTDTPIESKWVKFNTLEQAFNYSYPKKEIVKIIEKDNYAIVLYEYDSETITVTFFKKVDNKWFVTNPNNTNQKLDFMYPYCIITEISTDMKTKFVVVSYSEIIKNDKITVTDNFDTKFEYAEIMENSGYIMHEYYGIVENMEDDYYLTINGSTVLLNETPNSSTILTITVISCGIVWIIAYILFEYLNKKNNNE